MSPLRRTAVVAGVLYLVTHVTSVTAALALYPPALDEPEFVLGAGSSTRVLLGGLLEVVLALAVVGTAVTLYPVVRRRSEGLALGYVALRTLEAGVILVGVVTVLGVVTLREQAAGDPATLLTAAAALLAVHDWTFLVGPGLVCGTNTVVLAVALHRAGLVPRWITVLGMVGGPLVAASNTAVALDLYGQLSAPAGLAAVPVFAWEISLAAVLITRGFRSTPAVPPGPVAQPAVLAGV